MTKLNIQDINKYITMVRIEYPNAFPINARNDSERAELYKMLCSSWYLQLKKYPKEICDKAVLNALANAREGHYPRLGDVVFQINKLKTACEKTESDLWTELIKVLYEVENNAKEYKHNLIEENGLTQGENAQIRNQKIFDKLSSELKEYCHDVNGLVLISMYDIEQLSFERTRFSKALATIRENNLIKETMPKELENLIKNTKFLTLDNKGNINNAVQNKQLE